METRRLGRTGVDATLLSLGTEYLLDTPRNNVEAVVRSAVEAGVNYVDFFYAQAPIRDDMGHALAGIRDRVMLGGHFGAGEENGQYKKLRDLDESRRLFDDLLARLRIDYVDVLFLHNVDSEQDCDLALGPVLEQVQAYRDQGKCRFIGFSGHTAATSRRAVETGSVDVLMYPVHAGNHGKEGEAELLAECMARDVGVIAMKPYAGGKLLREGTGHGVTAVACLSYAASRLGVATVMPGPKNPDELADALHFPSASQDERDFAALLQHCSVTDTDGCVYCNHCLPCSAGIDIGAVSRLVDLHGRAAAAQLKRNYAALDPNAAACIECGECVERCPWGVDAAATMRRAVELYE